LVLIFHYDVNEKSQNKMTAYYILMCWYIAISAFQYSMGSDMPGYMNEYNDTHWKDISWNTLLGFNNRQFGWILLMNLSKLLSNDFVFLKTIQAIFVNVIFFQFFKRQTKAIFTSILLYSIYLYLDFNLNLMRQSIAVAIFLLGYRYYTDKSWLKYYIIVFISIMFHNSAIVLLFLPILQLLKINKKSLVLLSISILAFLLSIRLLPLTDLLLNSLTILIKSDIFMLAELYLNNEKYGHSNVPLISFLLLSLLYLWTIFFNYRYNLFNSTSDLLIVFTYLFIMILNSSIPIFNRFNLYFAPILISILSNFTIFYPKIKLPNFSKSFIFFFIIIFSYSSINALFQINTSYGDRQIVQFYPYYSVFNKKISPQRAMLWKSYY